MTDPKSVALKEYEIVCGMIEDHTRRMLTVKSWSITLATAGLAASSQFQSNVILFLVSCAAAAFWVLESGIRAFQRPFTLRARQLELFLSSGAEEEGFKTPWLSHSYKSAPKLVYALNSAFLPHVFLPNAPIAILGFTHLTINGFIPNSIKNLINLI